MPPFGASCAALLASAVSASATQSFETMYSGYLIDYYCLNLVKNGGRALDGSDVILAPWDHTLHCLRDIPQCRDGYYLAEKRESGEYLVKFQLDDASHDAVVDLLDSFPRGHSRDHASFAVTAVGQHSGDGILRGATFTACFDDVGCDSVCEVMGNGTCDTPDYLPPPEMPARSLLIAHVFFMCLSWGCLLPLGVVWARNMRQSKWKFGVEPAWFQGHRTLQSIGVVAQLLGFVCIYVFKGGNHFHTPHEILGLVVILLGVLQPLNAQLRHLECIGHPRADGTRTAGRVAWEAMHKGTGWACLALGVANVIFGPIYASNLGFDSSLVRNSIIFLALSLGTLTLGGVGLELRRLLGCGSQAPVPSDRVPKAGGADQSARV